MTVFTGRLVLHPVDADEARRIHDQDPAPDDRWAPDYPFTGDLAGLGAFLAATAQHGEQRPFGYYRVTQRADGRAIGGIGFKGPPEHGVVEIGYGLVPSARGQGYATEAVRAMVELAASLHVTAVRADTDLDNRTSQRVLEKAGFRVTGQDATVRWFQVDLEASRTPGT